MAASDHLNKRLFHGTSLRFGLVRPGEKIIPAFDLKKLLNIEHVDDISNYRIGYNETQDWDDIGAEEDDFMNPESPGLVHVTPNFKGAKNYARWAAMGGAYNRDEGYHRPVVYEVEPSHDMEPDEYDDGSYVSPTGFRVKNIAWIDDDNVPVIKKKGE